MSGKNTMDEKYGHNRFIRTNSCIPMILTCRKEELISCDFNIEDNELFLLFHPTEPSESAQQTRRIQIYYESEQGSSTENKEEDSLFALSIKSDRSQIAWKSVKYEPDEMEQIPETIMTALCGKVFKYVMDHPDNEVRRNILILYLKFFDLLKGHQEALLDGIRRFLEEANTPNYEQNKKLTRFLPLLISVINSAHDDVISEGPFAEYKPLPMGQFLTHLIITLGDHISELLKKNKFIHFHLDDRSTFADIYTNEVTLDSIEHLQFFLPELVLLLDREKQKTFANELIIEIDEVNETYQILMKREDQRNYDRFRSLGGNTREIAFSNLAICDIYGVEYSDELEALHFWENRSGRPKPNRSDKLTAYREFLEKCQTDGLYFFNWISGELSKKVKPVIPISGMASRLFRPTTPLETAVYFLQKFLNKFDSVRAVYSAPEAQKQLLDIFCKYIENCRKYGTLLIYHYRLKHVWSTQNLGKIENKLKYRKAAEDYFVSYFEEEFDEDVGHPPMGQSFKNNALRCPLAFFHAFIGKYMAYALDGYAEGQSTILKIFCLTLHKDIKLRGKIYTQGLEGTKFRRKLYDIIRYTSGSFVPTEVQTIFNRHWVDVINLYIWKSELNEYETSKLKPVRDLQQGGQSTTTLVKVPGFAAPVVAKFFTGQPNVTASALASIAADEIECLMKIQFNPHVVQIFGFIVENGSYIGVLMEYCPGGSLDRVILNDNQYNEKQIIWWALQAASGLTFLHDKAILHRDVKPANMLLDADHNLLKISDLGISKAVHDTTISHVSNVDFMLTKSWAGTPGFVPPDMGELYSTEVDVFALGRSIWSMILRKHPTDSEVDQTLKADTPDGTSKELWEFVLRMIGPRKKRPHMDECYTFFEELHETM